MSIRSKQTLGQIYTSRAFTPHQITSLILQRLEEVVKTIHSKLIIISDIAAMFLDKDVEKEEAKRIYNQVINRLAKFAKENQIIIIITYPPHVKNSRSMYFDALTLGHANVVIKINQTEYEKEIILEKHPNFTLGSTELPTEIYPSLPFWKLN